jgi:hypothetical protein
VLTVKITVPQEGHVGYRPGASEFDSEFTACGIEVVMTTPQAPHLPGPPQPTAEGPSQLRKAAANCWSRRSTSSTIRPACVITQRNRGWSLGRNIAFATAEELERRGERPGYSFGSWASAAPIACTRLAHLAL